MCPPRQNRDSSCSGIACQYNDKDTCNDNGQVQMDGTCKCKKYTSKIDGKEKQYQGKNCSYGDNECDNGIVLYDEKTNTYSCKSCICKDTNCYKTCDLNQLNCNHSCGNRKLHPEGPYVCRNICGDKYNSCMGQIDPTCT